MVKSKRGEWVCAVKRRASNRADYQRLKANPERLAAKREQWRRADENQRANPVVQLERQLRDLSRIRVSY